MAKAYIEIFVGEEMLQRFGGNASDVRYMKETYENLSLEEFLKMHNTRTEEDFHMLRVSPVYKR